MHSLIHFLTRTIYEVPLNHGSNTFYFIFQGVSWDNMANTNATPLLCMSPHSIRAQNNTEGNVLGVSLYKPSKAARSLVARLR